MVNRYLIAFVTDADCPIGYFTATYKSHDRMIQEMLEQEHKLYIIWIDE
jgi:hypothetical protein